MYYKISITTHPLEFTKLFNYHLLKMKETGVMRNIWAKQRSLNEHFDPPAGAITLGFRHTLFPFILLGIGVTVACFLALGECVTQRTQKHINK
jgi:hypothetical protein